LFPTRAKVPRVKPDVRTRRALALAAVMLAAAVMLPRFLTHTPYPRLGAQVQKAWAIAAGQTADVDGIAEARTRAFVSEGGLFKLFGSEAAALSYQDPYARSVTWLVRSSEGADKSSFVWGRNDLWAERFDVDAQSGAVTVTGEH
jgi:hypothetical protein